MIKNGFYCNDSKRLYHVSYNLINKMSEECLLDVEVVERGGLKTNVIVSKETNNILFESDNPLKIVDFLLGYQSALKIKINDKEKVN